MQAAQHVGKLVLVPDNNAGVVVSRATKLKLRRDGVYVVTGGVSGFGFATARWLAEQGAGHLALISRRGSETPGTMERMETLEAAGATVSIYGANVADYDALAAALATVRDCGVPIRGIVHAAATIIDGMAPELSTADIAASIDAKLSGALLLDRLTRDDPLDLFWLFSSATTLVGAPGQGAYVAANAALEGLARRRHAEGKPALAVAWGPIADVGMLAERPDAREALARRLGVKPMPAARALSALPAMVASGLPVVAVADIRWGGARQPLPGLEAPIFAELRDEAIESAGEEGFLDRLLELEPAPRRNLLADVVADELARVLRLPANDIDRHRPLVDLGMDSLMALELRVALERRLRIELPLTSLADGLSAVALATRLAERVVRPVKPGPVTELAARHEASPDPGDFDLAAGG
jgi:phthiocerol/phenolphthiocerol synthesis type-I polyketide synthase C